MKKPVLCLSLLLIIGLLFSACGSSGGSSPNTLYSGEDVSITQASAETTTETESVYLTENEDGIIALEQPDVIHCDMRNPLYDAEGNAFIFIWKNTDEVIPKVEKNKTLGIYQAYEEIEFIPIGDAVPMYTVPMNFYPFYSDDNGDGITENPLYFSGGQLGGVGRPSDNGDGIEGAWDFFRAKSSLLECNEEDLGAFVNANCDVFDAFKLIKADKNQEFEFGYYYGTEWKTLTAKACIEYYKVYPNTADEKITITVPTQPTKEGYFSVDVSTMESGVYYIPTMEIFIELV